MLLGSAARSHWVKKLKRTSLTDDFHAVVAWQARALTNWCGFNPMGLQNIGDRRVANLVTNFRECALNPVAAPRWIFVGELPSQINDHLTDSRASLFFLLAIRQVPFPGDQLSMPTQNRIRRKQRTELFELLSPQDLPLTARRRRWPSLRRNRFFPKLSLRTAFSVRRYSTTSCCR